MRKPSLTFLLLIISYISFSQDALVRKTKQATEEKSEFNFIEQATDTTTLEFISTFQSRRKNDEPIETLYADILELAKRAGANCFRLNSYSANDSVGKETLVLDTYYGSDSILMINMTNHVKNTIFIFGDEDTINHKTYQVKINGDKKTFPSGTYYKQIINPGEEVKINKGGFTGMTAKFTYKENKKAIFLFVTGFSPGGGNVPPGTIGVSFNTGRFDAVDSDFGYLLVKLLKQSN